MSAVLGPNSYGKSEVRLVKVDRGAERHELRDLTVDHLLQRGDPPIGLGAEQREDLAGLFGWP